MVFKSTLLGWFIAIPTLVAVGILTSLSYLTEEHSLADLVMDVRGCAVTLATVANKEEPMKELAVIQRELEAILIRMAALPMLQERLRIVVVALSEAQHKELGNLKVTLMASLHTLHEVTSTLKEQKQAKSKSVVLIVVSSIFLISITCGMALYRLYLLLIQLRDVNTELIEAKHENLLLADDLEITLDSIGDGVIVTNESGVVTRLNPLAEELTGWKKAEAVGKSIQDVYVTLVENLPGEDLANPVEMALALKYRIRPPQQSGRLLKSKDTKYYSIDDCAAPIMGSNGAIRGVVLVFRDVTIQRKMEKELQQSQKMETVGKLAGGVAHDLNNILQVVKANLAMIMDWSMQESDRQICLSQIEQASERAADLTRKLLAFGRKQTLKMRDIPTKRFFTDTMNLIGRVLGDNIKVSFVCPAAIDWLRVDSIQLEQVIMNLCINARDAMPNGGSLAVTVSNIELKPMTGKNTSKHKRFVKVEVSDTGTGIPHDILHLIFEPFFTTKQVGKGVGLGLAMAQGVICQHHGYIEVNSTLGEGTTFTFLLPSIPAQEESMLEQPSPSQPQGAGTILLAEDDPTVRSITVEYLKRAGFSVHIAIDGEEACILGDKFIGTIDLAVLDVMMPNKNGPETARYLRKLKPNLPIIFATGYADGLDKGDWKVVAKPYAPQALVEIIKEAMFKQKMKEKHDSV